MPTPAPAGIIVGMGEHLPYRRLLLELSDDEPITGRIWTATGDPRPFSGWIGLAATITDWLSESEDAKKGREGK